MSAAATSIPVYAQCELRAVIRFLHSTGETPISIHRKLCQTYGTSCMSLKNVRKWCREFSGGRTEVHDEQRSGRPSISDELKEQIERELREDRRVTVRDLEQRFELSKSTIQRFFNVMGYHKCCARWVPKMLTEDHKRQRIETSREFLTRYAEQGEVFLDSIVTGDETWVYHFTPESKQQSLEWRHSRSPKKRKFKVTQSDRKIMATVFWDRKGVLLIEFMPTGTTINAASYCEILKKLRRAIQNRRRGMLTKGVCLLHDNARPHVARDTKALLEKFGWDVISHPPYSPDLAPSDYHLLLNLKKHLGGKRLETDEEVKTEVTQYLNKELAASFYEAGIQKLPVRLEKCIQVNGDYVEK